MNVKSENLSSRNFSNETGAQSDSNECLENHKILWENIVKETDDKRRAIEEYKMSKNKDYKQFLNPAVKYLDNVVFPVLNNGLVKMLQEVKADKSLSRPKTTFNGVDFLCEYLYNSNPKYPERQNKWTYIFDTDWAKASLKQKPRPYFPFSRIWSRDFAALKIQAFMQGYWVRRNEDVQEMRKFWKAIKN